MCIRDRYSDYINQANEKHAQTWDFRGKNQTLKDDTGNYYIDPVSYTHLDVYKRQR